MVRTAQRSANHSRGVCRFKDIVDLGTGITIMELEHEIRSTEHRGNPLGRDEAAAKEMAVFVGTDTPVF